MIPAKPPGRKPRYQGIAVSPTKVIDAVDKRCIRIGYSLFVGDKTSTITNAYVEMLRRFYTAKDLSKNPESGGRLLPESEIPSFRQFDYWGKAIFSTRLKTERGRKGMRKWLKDCRPLSGTVRDWLRGPCHQFEIDATIADIYLVNGYSRRMLIGRPVVYVVIDSFSGMIVGLYIGLEGPSWNGARQALFNAFTSKVEFCATNGVTIDSGDGPVITSHITSTLTRGEMLGKAAEGLPLA